MKAYTAHHPPSCFEPSFS